MAAMKLNKENENTSATPMASDLLIKCEPTFKAISFVVHWLPSITTS